MQRIKQIQQNKRSFAVFVIVLAHKRLPANEAVKLYRVENMREHKAATAATVVEQSTLKFVYTTARSRERYRREQCRANISLVLA